MREMKRAKRTSSNFDYKGFTLVELLVALMVASIVLTAVATLAYALGTANDASDDSAERQAQVRYATLRISELIRHCKLVHTVSESEVVLWRADDNNNGQIDAAEQVSIEARLEQGNMQLCESSGLAEPVVLIPQCSNVRFMVDSAAPWSKFVSISFDVSENGVVRQYQISTALRSWAGHLLDGSGNIVSDDD
jgi:prepilin-type N-terminal cleavage/methylation domain-containing protein